GFQSFDDPVVAPPFASFRDIGLQQDPRLQYPARRALSFPNQRFKPFSFLAAQPHNILLYRNLLRSHDCLPRQSLATKANHQILSNWLKRATSSLILEDCRAFILAVGRSGRWVRARGRPRPS